MTASLAVGDTVVLEPEGTHGRVAEVWHESEESVFQFTSHALETTVRLADEGRWRRPLAPDEARRVEARVAAARPIPGLQWDARLADTGTSASAWKLVDAYLDGDQDQRVTAYATLLDWQTRAKGQGLAAAPWRGRLAEAQSNLLGELALVAGLPFDGMLERVAAAREKVPGAERVTVGTPPTPIEEPRCIVPDPGWTPGPAATHELGAFEIQGAAALLTSGWSHPGPDMHLQGSEDCLVLSLAPGRWVARLVVQSDIVPVELANELATHPDGRYLESVFTAVYRRPWLVLARDTVRADIPRPLGRPGAELLAEAQRACDASGCDAVEASRLEMQIGADRAAPLVCVGRLEPWTHRIAFVAGASLSRGASASLRASAEHVACSWGWGLAFRCGRSGLLPIFATGPEGALVALAIPGAV